MSFLSNIKTKFSICVKRNILISSQFLVENVHTKGELKMTGNCLKASRPLLSFDKNFDAHPHLVLIKELFIQVRKR